MNNHRQISELARLRKELLARGFKWAPQHTPSLTRRGGWRVIGYGIYYRDEVLFMCKTFRIAARAALNTPNIDQFAEAIRTLERSTPEELEALASEVATQINRSRLRLLKGGKKDGDDRDFT